MSPPHCDPNSNTLLHPRQPARHSNWSRVVTKWEFLLKESEWNGFKPCYLLLKHLIMQLSCPRGDQKAPTPLPVRLGEGRLDALTL